MIRPHSKASDVIQIYLWNHKALMSVNKIKSENALLVLMKKENKLLGMSKTQSSNHSGMENI